MKNKLIFLNLIILTITNINAMKRPYKYRTKQPHTKINLSNTPSFYDLLSEIQNIIIDLWTHKTLAKTPKDAARIVTALACVNKHFNGLINSPQFSDKLIDNFARKFSCSHETIAQFLHTEQSNKRYTLQAQLKQICNSEYKLPIINQKLKKLITAGADLEFMYNHKSQRTLHKKTVLMICTSDYDNQNAFQALLNAGAKINTRNINGLTTLHFATQWPMKPFYYKKLLTRSNLIINQQNNDGETALLGCIINRQKHAITRVFINAISDLLKVGADPHLANTKGITPLDAARQLNNQQVIRMIQEAIEKK